MSTYFISDIHGEYELFIKLLKTINFSSTDILFILGDIIDKGKDSIKLLEYISKQNNMFAIMGNHECSFAEYVNGIIDSTPNHNYDLIIQKIQKYFPEGSGYLSPENISYLVNLPFYIETENFICIHAGLEIVDNKILPMSKQNYKYMIFDRNFKNKEFEPISKPILLGHTPCFYDQLNGKFIKHLKPNHDPHNFSSYSKIRLDTGVNYTQMLGVLKMEDMQEIYVKK